MLYSLLMQDLHRNQHNGKQSRVIIHRILLHDGGFYPPAQPLLF